MSVRTPIIAIVGRPNVGKSTLFNRMLGDERAVVEDIAGVTRDRNYARVDRFEVPFYVVDTGGFEKDPKEEMSKLVVEQTQVAIDEADAVVVLFDGNAGVRPGDRDVVDHLRGIDKPVIFAVNKCDGVEQQQKVLEFYELGVSELLDVSALYGHGLQTLVDRLLTALSNYDLLVQSARDKYAAESKAADEAEYVAAQKVADERAKELKEYQEIEPEEEPEPLPEIEPEFAPVYVPMSEEEKADGYEKENRLRSRSKLDRYSNAELDPEEVAEYFAEDEDVEQEPVELPLITMAIIGRPNVGKSTLLNTITGESRAITSNVAGTTRDTLDFQFRREGQEYLILDTAGLRRKGRVTDEIEKYSTLRSLRALSDCDVAVVMLDAVEGPTDQDAKIAGLAHEAGKGIVVVVNKWDLVEKDHKTIKEYEQKVRTVMKFIQYAPIVYASALSGRRCPSVIETVKKVAQARSMMVNTGRLNRVLRRALDQYSPSSYRGRPIKLYYATQLRASRPMFFLYFNYPRQVHFSHMRFMKNAIREEFGFEGTDIKLIAKKRT